MIKRKYCCRISYYQVELAKTNSPKDWKFENIGLKSNRAENRENRK